MAELVHVEGICVEDPVLIVQVLPRAVQRRTVSGFVRDGDPVKDAERGEIPRNFEGRNRGVFTVAGVPV